jgi:hypothetical protein
MSERQEIEKKLEQARKSVEFGAAIERLKSNRDFKKVVVEAYFEKEAVRLVHAKVAPDMQTPEKQAALDADIRAIGTFRQYLDTALFFAERSAAEIQDGEAILEEIAREELDTTGVEAQQ